ncbi:thioredoxin family protein [Metabacillus sediminilitoris]|uniref:Thioredoxin family protein n=1 Tax=Metabacillus sediminilitoris TaxID=2567941 RepID=A0A4S4BJ28_9BACI|nr:thioredoxin family protein [Metabacillus sediminilitoris]QGQ45079.1 thioredoxin family protein [Metabacillus sediminilitoris]THF74640.1 thioredoxin family protein [Metabacillus sediminilitoris]
MSLNDWFLKGLTYEQYTDQMNVNKDDMLSIYNRFTLNEDDDAFLEKIQDKQLRVIVLTEDWCGDALVNNPILMKVAEAANMEVRFLLRDQNLELMDQYLTNGTSRSIPIFIFIDQNGNEQAVWGPRAQKIQNMVDLERAKLPAADSPNFKDKQSEMFKKFRESYLNDESIWEHISYSMITLLKGNDLHHK